jgi:putative addiction module killer protein
MDFEIEIYQSSRGRCPFEDWVLSIREVYTRSKIYTRLDRLKMGNFGDCKALGDGVFELRIHCGPGYRVYFGRIGSQIILLLCAGDKGSPEKDILKAKEYLEDYEKRR